MIKKELPEINVEEFKSDWDKLSYTGIGEKYKIAKNTIKKIAKQYNLPLPKPKVYSKINVITHTEATPQSVMGTIQSSDLGMVGIETIQELKECNEEFMRITNDSAMQKRDKDDMLFKIAEKAMCVFVSLQPNAKKYIECMADFYKLKLYERRVIAGDKEDKAIDEQTLKNLKKKFIGEALDDICAALTDSERRFFEHLVQQATDRILSEKRKANEAQQQRVMEVSGQVDADMVTQIEPEVVAQNTPIVEVVP